MPRGYYDNAYQKSVAERHRRKARQELLAGIVGALVLVLVIGLAIWAWVALPCEWYRFSSAKDIPGRCLIEDRR